MLLQTITPLFKIVWQLELKLFPDHFEKQFLLEVKIFTLIIGVVSQNLYQSFDEITIAIYFNYFVNR